MNVWDYYMAFDVFLGTSISEGFGTTAIEAQSMGLPTFLSTGFPMTTVITKYAFRIDLKESPRKWAKCVIRNCSRIRSKNDMTIVDKAGFSASSVSKKIESFYLEHSQG